MSVLILFLAGIDLSLFLLLTSFEGEDEMEGRERLHAGFLKCVLIIESGSLKDQVHECSVDSLAIMNTVLDALDVVRQLRVDEAVLPSQTPYKDLHAVFMYLCYLKNIFLKLSYL